ncbi:MAG: hypothetical protein ABJA60_00055 [Nitrosospira sp.]
MRKTTHMQGPVAAILNETIRVYFAARDINGKSYAAYLDVNKVDPQKLLYLHEQSIMPPGPLGTFDDDGQMPACAVPVDDKLWLYYSGWNRRVTIPCHNTTGLAISCDNGKSFQRAFDGPILERTPYEPYMAVTPWVMRESNIWRMWYVSGLSWQNVGGLLEPVYGIKYAESTDGIGWHRPNLLAVSQHHAMQAMARPTVIHQGDKYHMWFCHRDSLDFRDGKGSYRIGYAYSKDGVVWQRDDKLAGIEPSDEGWDSKMLCYPYVIEVDGVLIMFYNGNSFGQTGIGCAVWEGTLS